MLAMTGGCDASPACSLAPTGPVEQHGRDSTCLGSGSYLMGARGQAAKALDCGEWRSEGGRQQNDLGSHILPWRRV